MKKKEEKPPPVKEVPAYSVGTLAWTSRTKNKGALPKSKSTSDIGVINGHTCSKAATQGMEEMVHHVLPLKPEPCHVFAKLERGKAKPQRFQTPGPNFDPTHLSAFNPYTGTLNRNRVAKIGKEARFIDARKTPGPKYKIGRMMCANQRGTNFGTEPKLNMGDKHGRTRNIMPPHIATRNPGCKYSPNRLFAQSFDGKQKTNHTMSFKKSAKYEPDICTSPGPAAYNVFEADTFRRDKAYAGYTFDKEGKVDNIPPKTAHQPNKAVKKVIDDKKNIDINREMFHHTYETMHSINILPHENNSAWTFAPKDGPALQGTRECYLYSANPPRHGDERRRIWDEKAATAPAGVAAN